MSLIKLNNYQLGKLKEFGIEYKVIESKKNNHIIKVDNTDSNVKLFIRINNTKEVLTQWK